MLTTTPVNLVRASLIALGVSTASVAFAVGSWSGLVGDVADPVEFLLVNRSLQVSPIRVTGLNDAAVVQRDRAPVKLADCVALINPSPNLAPSKSTSVLALADGQRLPGEPFDLGTEAPSRESFAWNHPWLGRLDVPLKLVSTLSLRSGVEPLPATAADVVILANGDRYDGLVAALGNPLSIEMEKDGQRETVSIPLDRIVSVSMINPRQQPKGRRIWFGEGTVLDVGALTVGDDNTLRLTGSNVVSGTQVTRLGLGDVAAIQFDPKAMLPLASLAPSRIEGPATRFVIPKPRVLDGAAPLDLARIEFRGPIVVRYALPAGCQRLAAEASLPAESRAWGDCEVVVRSDDTEVFRARLNEASPTAAVNVQLTGRELTIEITQGAHGPIQDNIVLTRAMLLRKN